MSIFRSRQHPRRFWIGLLSVCLACAACSEGSGAVTRMADGVRYEGRFISPEAYAAYAIGVTHETRGEYEKAASWYRVARSEDPRSPEVFARIGAVQCLGSPPARGPLEAAETFARGIQTDATYCGNYFERARCEERARSFAAALADANAAIARCPADEPTNLLVARVLEALGRVREARAWIEAYRMFSVSSIGAVRPPAASAAQPADAAEGAERSFAFRELRAGRFEAARAHAKLELAADPSDADAWIATLAACDALRDAACFDDTLNRLRFPSLAPSDRGLALLQEILVRRAGAELRP